MAARLAWRPAPVLRPPQHRDPAALRLSPYSRHANSTPARLPCVLSPPALMRDFRQNIRPPGHARSIAHSFTANSGCFPALGFSVVVRWSAGPADTSLNHSVDTVALRCKTMKKISMKQLIGTFVIAVASLLTVNTANATCSGGWLNINRGY